MNRSKTKVIRLITFIILVIEEIVEGKNYRGRPRMCYERKIIEDVKIRNHEGMKRFAEDRTNWRAATNQFSD